MSLDDARIRLLREIGGESNDPEAHAHLSDCATCATTGATRSASGGSQAAPSRPVRPAQPPPIRTASPCDPDRRRRGRGAHRRIGARRLVRLARAGLNADQDRAAEAEELLDPEFRKQILRTAVQEKERLAEDEKKLAEAEAGYVKAKAMVEAKQTKEAAELTESSAPSIWSPFMPSIRRIRNSGPGSSI